MHAQRPLLILAMAIAVTGAGCAKKIELRALPLVAPGKATAKVELTYNRNNTIEVKLSKVPDPSKLQSGFTRYVLWAARPGRQDPVNIGQLRVDEKQKADIKTLTPLRRFILFITAETTGDVITPGPELVFESKEINW